MTWFKIDDGFYDHPKTLALEAGPCFGDAVALWTLAGTWCARQLTDGAVPERQVRRLGFGARVAHELVRVGLWTRVEGGYSFHEWTEHQPSRAEVEEVRRSKTDRQRRWRHSQQQRGSSASSDANATGAEAAAARLQIENLNESAPQSARVDASTGRLHDVVVDALRDRQASPPVDAAPSRPVPTRPDPTIPLTTFGGEDARVRATPGVVSGSHMQEFSELLRAEAFASGYTASPRLVGTQLRDAADRAREMAEHTGDSYADAAGKLIRSALAAAKTTGKAVGLVLLDIEPSRPPPTRASGGISADRTRARATTHEDFKDAEPIEVQLERMRKRKEERRGNAQPNAL